MLKIEGLVLMLTACTALRQVGRIVRVPSGNLVSNGSHTTALRLNAVTRVRGSSFWILVTFESRISCGVLDLSVTEAFLH